MATDPRPRPRGPGRPRLGARQLPPVRARVSCNASASTRVHDRLTILGAGPAYTSRPGAVELPISSGPATVTPIVLDLGQGSFADLAGAVEPSSDRSSSATSIPITTSISSRSAHLPGTRSAPPGCRPGRPWPARSTPCATSPGLGNRARRRRDASARRADRRGTLHPRRTATRSGCRPARVRVSSTRAIGATSRPVAPPRHTPVGGLLRGRPGGRRRRAPQCPRRRPAPTRRSVGCS